MLVLTNRLLLNNLGRTAAAAAAVAIFQPSCLLHLAACTCSGLPGRQASMFLEEKTLQPAPARPVFVLKTITDRKVSIFCIFWEEGALTIDCFDQQQLTIIFYGFHTGCKKQQNCNETAFKASCIHSLVSFQSCKPIWF